MRPRREPTDKVAETTVDATPQGLAYERITTEEQRELLETRMRALEAEHFQHNSNLKVAVDSGSEELARQARVAMVAIEQAHASIAAQAKALKD